MESWPALLDALLAAPQRECYERHLESCPACQDRIDRLGADELGWRRLGQELGDPTIAPADPTLTHVVERLQEGPPLAPALPGEPADLSFVSPAARPGLLGTLGRYEVFEVIGRGGMGIVLKAFDPMLQRLVAIKVLAMAGATARQRFTREARAAAAVRHEHIVPVHEVAEAAGRPYLVMQYVAGESLQARLDRAGPLPIEDIVRIGLETAAGLAASHAQGLIHRDIKPANILLEGVAGGEWRVAGEEGGAVSSPATHHPPPATRVKLTDFGLARLTDEESLTQTGVVAGTPEYMAPEQARGEVVDARADLFSLGSVLYALCTGAPPFRAATPLAVLRQVSDTAPRPVRSLNHAVPSWLEALITRLLAKDPADRYQSAAEVAALLEGRRNGLNSSERERKEEHPGWASPSPRRLGLATLTALTILLLGLFGFGADDVDGKPGELREVLFHDFRNPPAPPSFTFWGDPEGKFLKAEPEGMRITLPATYVHPFGGIGYLIEQDFQGDFEVTATVEVLHADPPQIGYGVGVVLVVNKAAPAHGEWASLGRQKRAQSGEVLYSATGQDLPPGYEGVEEPCTDRMGKLRLKRTGTTLSYLWAPGPKAETFRTLHRCDFGLEPIKSVRLTAVTGRQPCKVDVRLIDVQIRSGPASIAPKRWLARRPVVALGLSLGLLILLGAWLHGRQRRRARTMCPAPVSSSAGQGKGEGKDKQSSPATSSPSLTAQCSACGQELKLRPDLAGKKVKCPQCDQAVLIPETKPAPLAPPASTDRFSILKNRGVVASVLVLAIVASVCSWLFWPWRDKYWYLNTSLGNQFIPEVQESGFHQEEFNKAGEPYRWTNGNARLVIPIDRRKPPTGLVVQLFLVRPAQVNTVWVQIVANNHELTKQQVSLEKSEGMSWSPPGVLDLTGIDVGDELVLDIISDTFIPQETTPRTLGVVVRRVELLHEAPPPQ
jgi:serine/threonine protein kinase